MIKIHGQVQHYAWGGQNFIASLLGLPNTDGAPHAEYWLGVHPSAPATLTDSGDPTPLSHYLRDNNAGEIQFLFKVLDVKDMLSIQAHPTRAQATAGFLRENAEGIDPAAAHRNYKDQNDKPELAVALSDFWLLHGIAREHAVFAALERREYLTPLLRVYQQQGIRGAFSLALDAYHPHTRAMHDGLVHELTERHYSKSDIEFWMQRWLRDNPETPNGILTLFFLNLVHLIPGEAIFQPAGLLHAYLEGQNIELMANSDNVLRAGLTPKHIDVGELLKIALLTDSDPEDYLIRPQATAQGEIRYPTPFPAFELSLFASQHARQFNWSVNTPEILFCLDGEAQIAGTAEETRVCRQGDAFALCPQQQIAVQGEHFSIYRARNLQ